MIKKKYYLLVFITMLLCFSVSAQMPLLIYEKSAKDTIELLEAIDNLKEIKNQKEFKYLELNRKMEKHVYDSILIVNDSIRNIRNDYYDKRVSALHELVREHFYYEELKNYQEILLPSLWYEYVNGSYKKQATQLLALLELPDFKKDSLLKDLSVPGFVKARLRDKREQNKIIKDFKISISSPENELFSKRFDYTERLLYINSDESLDAFFEAFQSEITYWKESLYYEKEYLNNWSLLSNMLWVLYKFHPIKLFRDRDSYLEKGLPLGEEETFEYLEPYYILVEKAIKDLYGREIKIKAPYLSRSKFQ